jgi:hypothetical protein
MPKIDLDEMEATLAYSEDWKKLLKELKAARKCIELLTEHRYEFVARIDKALEEYEGLGEK